MRAQAWYCRFADWRGLRRRVATGGQFRKATVQDMGTGGTCPTCGHFLLRHYDGDPRDEFPDPRKFQYRCFTCEPETEAEKALKAEIEAAQKPASILDFIRKASEP